MKKIEQTLQRQTKDIIVLKQEAQKIVIRNTKDVINAIEFLSKLKKKIKALEQERLKYTAPLNQSLKNLNSTFKTITEPLKNFEKEIKVSILMYRQDEEKRKNEREKKLQKENKNKNIHLKTAPTVIESKSGKIRIPLRLKFKIINLKKIPLKYLKLNEIKVREDINNGMKKIPGIKIYKEESISIY